MEPNDSWFSAEEWDLLEDAPTRLGHRRFLEFCNLYALCVFEYTLRLELDEKNEVAFTRREYAVTVLSGRLIAAARAIGILAGAGYVDEGYALLRRFLEIAARTKWIAAVDDDSRAHAWLNGRVKVGRTVLQSAGDLASGDLYGALSQPLHGDAAPMIDHEGVAGGDPIRSWKPTSRPKDESRLLAIVTAQCALQLKVCARVFNYEPSSVEELSNLTGEMVQDSGTKLRARFEALPEAARLDEATSYLDEIGVDGQYAANLLELFGLAFSRPDGKEDGEAETREPPRRP